jgi:hypothetical protein
MHMRAKVPRSAQLLRCLVLNCAFLLHSDQFRPPGNLLVPCWHTSEWASACIMAFDRAPRQVNGTGVLSAR